MFIANGTINFSGDAVLGDSGFTVEKPSTGFYILTHNLDTTEFSVSTSQAGGDQSNPIHILHSKQSDNQVSFYTRITNTASDIDTEFDFTFISYKKRMFYDFFRAS